MDLSPEPAKKTPRPNKWLSFFLKSCLILMVIAGCITAGRYAFKMGYQYVKKPDSSEKQNIQSEVVEVTIPQGASTRDIAKILKDKGLIKYPILFRSVSRIKHNDGDYQQGKHQLDTSMDYEAIMNELKKNVDKRETKKFTIQEGLEYRQIVDKLVKENLINKEKFMDIAENGDFDYVFLKDLPKRKNRLEGYLFPETYEIYADATEEDIIKKMLDQFEKEFKQEYYDKAKQLGMTVDQVVTLASIIEREAKLDDERPLISAVFHNRLKSKNYQLLQSCATVQYVLGERKEVLSEEDTKIESPYNTYKYPGLPLGPIASPGRESIKAALYPAEAGYMFFVANSDGSHIYSKTYAEHLSAMKKVK
ncbi:endolytic transglycosylase MltG [Petroclostridium sp. X23]|uniref:endolytic transglycosylase MltG n=1 Tax=Petroclostridium sp. X23 TaxID=3045146 RepID=UPI0024AE3E4A|nr:endolytic transglycosylase MltG [Petroclostridium sp. X23]WHH60218.1 endolytic transglycosylase MltG [Petroclostridium sp. X23]